MTYDISIIVSQYPKNEVDYVLSQTHGLFVNKAILKCKGSYTQMCIDFVKELHVFRYGPGVDDEVRIHAPEGEVLDNILAEVAMRPITEPKTIFLFQICRVKSPLGPRRPQGPQLSLCLVRISRRVQICMLCVTMRA